MRSVVCYRATLQQAVRHSSINCRSKLFESHLQHTPTVNSWSVVRCYATKKKNKEKKKEKEVKSKLSRVQLTKEEIGGIIDVDAMNQEYQAVLDHLKHEYIHSLALRTSTGAFDQLIIQTDDGPFPLNQLAQIVQKSPTLLIINLAAMPQYTGTVLEAIKNSGMNVNPQQEGTHTIYVPIPKISREHRENLAKSAKTLFNQAKDKLKHVNQKYTKMATKKEIKEHHSEDLIRNVSKMILEEMHVYDYEAEKLMKAKTKELLGEN